MVKGLSKIATGFAMISEGINEIIIKIEQEKNLNNKEINKAVNQAEEEIIESKIQVSKEDVRAVLAKKSQEGKIKEVKALLNKYGAEKLTSVKAEEYRSLLKEAEVL